MTESTSEKLVEVAKRRGFFSQTAESYGGVAGFYTFGPEGAELKRNIENLWRDRFNTKEGHREIEAPTIMPEPVFEASGHLETFDDMIIECPECQSSIRADHLVEDNTNIEEAESFPTDKVEQIIEDEDLVCSSCGFELSGIDVNDFNLMFETNIGPGDSNPGYLRPETAQGIFAEFPRFKEYARNQLPFGITQIGKAYRNEISPRKSIIRVREFTQAELEHFIHPHDDEPNLEKVEDVELVLYPATEQQKDEGEYKKMTVNEAVEKNVIESDWVAYYLGVAKRWYSRVGIDMTRFRYRQHLEGERAHYASDCWDAEAEIDGDWIEISGFSDRGCYDLKKHQEHSEESYEIFEQFDEPVTEEKAKIDPDMSWMGPTYGDHASEILEELERMVEEEPQIFERKSELRIEFDEKTFNIPVDKLNFEIVEEEKNGERLLPHVIEPSFGVDRILYAVMDHSFEEDEVDGEERTVLSFETEVAPSLVAVFPLMDKDGMGEKAREVAENLRSKGFETRYDDSGAIGRRYRRQDEIGTPYCVTVDHETLEDGTVTVRDRDSTDQKRVDLEELEKVLERLGEGEISFSDL
ncbi:MAG: glycine--tRNA ligase [Nanohaloarchaea archaeon]|nr:glycine--tRNA ligase [Candidatus Nanohaloarchaea archaeon]